MRITDVQVQLVDRPAGPPFRWRAGLPGSDPAGTGAARRIVTDAGIDGLAHTGRGVIVKDLGGASLARRVDWPGPAAKGVALASHLGINTHLCMAISNTTYYESLVYTNPVVREPAVDEHGLVQAPTAPGIGYESRWETA